MIIFSDLHDKTSQDNNATLLKNQQDADAAVLKEVQDMAAMSVENKEKPTCTAAVEVLQKESANALKSAQKKAAVNLKITHADNAKAIKKNNEIINEKDSVITWLTGGYSLTDNKDS
jgi:predicted RNA-binding protein Jag